MIKIKFFTFALAVLFMSACKKENKSKNATQKFTISYEMSCTDATVTYSIDETNTTSEYHKSSGWTKSFEAKKGQTVHLIVYNTSSVPQGVGAKILLNGKVIKEGTNFCPISGYTWLIAENLGN
jgi:hypothetical protein